MRDSSASARLGSWSVWPGTSIAVVAAAMAAGSIELGVHSIQTQFPVGLYTAAFIAALALPMLAVTISLRLRKTVLTTTTLTSPRLPWGTSVIPLTAIQGAALMAGDINALGVLGRGDLKSGAVSHRYEPEQRSVPKDRHRYIIARGRQVVRASMLARRGHDTEDGEADQHPAERARHRPKA